MATVFSSSTNPASSRAYFDTAAGVASLDSPHLNQTKLEIRTLVGEIANLATSELGWQEFLDAALPRICQAMGATAAAVWELDSDSQLTLAGHCKLPPMLSSGPPQQPSSDWDNHQRILACVAQEGSAVLVPPKSTRLSADRPANPLDESLLVVPIKIFERYETLLEVIQPHSGGPAAQRGYLRFVAQMADLVAEYLRLRELRSLSQAAGYVEALREALVSVGSGVNLQQRLQQLTRSWANMLDADLAIAVTRKPSLIPGFQSRRWQVMAVSDIQAFDSRSEIVQAAQAWCGSAVEQESAEVFGVLPGGVGGKQDVGLNAGASSDEGIPNAGASGYEGARRLGGLLGCEHLIRVQLNHNCQVVLALSGSPDMQRTQCRAEELRLAFQPLIAHLRESPPRTSIAARTLAQRLERLVVRASAILLVVSLALFPVPDSLSTPAVLDAVDKQFYFAPSDATVAEVLVDSHQQLKPGDSIAVLVDPQLQAKIEELEGQQLSIASQLEQDRAMVLRGQSSTRSGEDELRVRIDQSKLSLVAINQQLEILRHQADALHIRSKGEGLVTTWDAKNRLQGRPVASGQLLLTTYSPTTHWQLKLSIPERQVGRIQDELAKSPSGLSVQYSLSSHPGHVNTGRLVSLSKQLIKDQAGNSSVMGIVRVQADQLPAHTDGAVARASIDCGRTFAGWLLIRDAYRQATTWWRLL